MSYRKPESLTLAERRELLEFFEAHTPTEVARLRLLFAELMARYNEEAGVMGPEPRGKAAGAS